VSVKELPEKENSTFVRRLFRDVLKNVEQKMGASPNDYLIVNIDHPSLDSPVWLELTQAKNLTEEKLLSKIESVQQSKKEFLIPDGGWKSTSSMLNTRRGAAETEKNHLHLDKDNFKKTKQAIVQIVNPWDSLCLPRAIVVTRLHA
jgi:hypothetical protein